LGLVCSEELEETASTVISATLSTFAAEVGLKQPDQGLRTPYVFRDSLLGVARFKHVIRYFESRAWLCTEYRQGSA
jgi:hypothetical protein